MHYLRARIPGALYFFTLITHQRKSIFSDPAAVHLYRQAIASVQQKHPFDIEAEVILPDHLHVIWALPEGDSDFSTRWMLIKSFVTRTLGKREKKIWQNRFWEHTIRDDRDYDAHIDYIHFNPVQHGYVKAAADWPYSSFKSFVDREIYTIDWGSDVPPPKPKWVMGE